MKNFNQIVFVINCLMFSSVVAMEIVPIQHQRWYIDIDNKIVEDFVGSPVRYDDVYKSREFRNKVVSFPVECTDPLPIEYCGDIRFFKTSTMALTILDPGIKLLAIVRGITKNNKDRINIYLGLETDKIKLLNEGCKRIYPAKVLAYHREKANDVQFESWYPQCFSLCGVTNFGIWQIIEELNKKFPAMKNYDLNSFAFQFYVKKLLDRSARDFNFETLQFNFQKCYS